MVNRTGVILFLVIGAVAVGGLISTVANSVTGQYTASGGGRWYYGPQLAQLDPEEACVYAGCQASYPTEVYTGFYGTMMSACICNGQRVGVPLVQKIYVPPPRR